MGDNAVLEYKTFRKTKKYAARNFPKTFGFRMWNAPRPLKVGICEDFIAFVAASGRGGPPPDAVKAFLAAWVRRVEYLKALAAGGNRIGLAARPVAAVDEKIKTASIGGAINALKRRQRKLLETKAAQSVEQERAAA
jgi:sRNA-binding protein